MKKKEIPLGFEERGFWAWEEGFSPWLWWGASASGVGRPMKRWTIHLEVNTNSEEREPPTSNPKLLDLGANFEINNRIFSFELDVHLLKFRGTNGGFILWSRELLDPSQRFAQKELNLPEMKYQDEDLARFISYFTLCATRCHLKKKKIGQQWIG